MDDHEKKIHAELKISSWSELKINCFYKDFSPVDSFEKEFQIQLLHYTSYFKLYSAHNHLIEMNKLLIPNTPEYFSHLSNFIQDIFTVCDLLAGQIFITYFNEALWNSQCKPTISNLNLHAFHTNNRILNKIKNLTPKAKKRFIGVFRRNFQKISNPKNTSWYNDLKYYRNSNTHGIIRFVGRNRRNFWSLLKKEMFEKNLVFIEKNKPVHNSKPNKRNLKRMKSMLRDDSIEMQCNNYYNKVADLSSLIWKEMLNFYLMSPAPSGTKLFHK